MSERAADAELLCSKVLQLGHAQWAASETQDQVDGGFGRPCEPTDGFRVGDSGDIETVDIETVDIETVRPRVSMST